MRSGEKLHKSGLDLAMAKGSLWLHESGTYVRFTPCRRRSVRA